ncbi:hypothetical protein H0H92_004758, partial [Tricholoma furcatifolium]
VDPVPATAGPRFQFQGPNIDAADPRVHFQAPSVDAAGLRFQLPVLNVDDKENYFFVVLHGIRPGVYHGRSAANAACGHGIPTVVHQVFTRDIANAIFVEAFMHREIIRFE